MPNHFLCQLNNFTFPSAVCEGSDFSTSCQHLLLCLILAVLVAMKWYFFIVFICSSLKTNAVEHLFMGLLIICTFSLEDVYSNLSPIFNWITSLYCWAIVRYIFFGYMIFKSFGFLIRYMICKYLLLPCGLYFQLPHVILWNRVLNFEVQFIWFFSFVSCGFSAIALPNPKSQRLKPVFSSKGFVVLALTFIY